MRGLTMLVAGLVGAACASPVRAEVVAQTDRGFSVVHQTDIAAPPGEVYRALVAPARWWNPEHSFTGDASNFILAAQAGGCFCELIRDPAGSKERFGSIEHGRVIHAHPGKVLRIVGALGPLQSEALNATLTITMKPIDGGTRVVFAYVVGGYMRFDGAEIAPAIDTVIGGQLARLAALFDPLAPEAGEKAGAAPAGPPLAQPLPTEPLPVDEAPSGPSLDEAMEEIRPDRLLDETDWEDDPRAGPR